MLTNRPRPIQAPRPRPAQASVFADAVRRLRGYGSIFGDRVKLSLRERNDENQLSRLTPPYAQLIPTVDRPRNTRPPDQPVETLDIPRSFVVMANFDAKDSNDEFLAIDQAEEARMQLISCFVNWQPRQNYKPTQYQGSRVISLDGPNVVMAFVFTLQEQLTACDDEPCNNDPPNPFDMDVCLT